MKTSQRGVDIIKSFEGLRLDAYLDSVGVPTIGYGSTAGVKIGDTITEDAAEERLRDDLASAEGCVSARTPNVTQNQFDALVSFVFNVGCNNFGLSKMRKMIVAGDTAGAANEFVRYTKDEDGNDVPHGWIHAGGMVLKGLVKRRQAERQLFLTPEN